MRLILFLIVLANVGCGAPSAPPQAKVTPSTPADAPHSHGTGPNGGAIGDWGGGKYHVEFIVDHDKKQATVFVLGDDAKTPAPIKVEKVTVAIDEPRFEFEAAAEPLEGEAEGKASRFVGTHDNLGTVQEFAGSISGKVDDTPYVGTFKEEPAK